MIKLKTLIVDANYKLIGFIGEGTDKEFGGMTKDKVVRPISLKHIFDVDFSNRQIVAKRGTIIEKEGFKLNDLSMTMLLNNSYIPVVNTITLTKRYVQDNENIGFEVIIGDDENKKAKFTYENVIKMCDLFKPTNFIIRSGKDNKRFIAGKAGFPLTDLEVEVIGEASTAKRTKSTTKQSEAVTGGFVTEIDILDLYDFIRSVNGFIINLPGTEYKATTESASATEDFIPFNIGEVGSPWIDFNETKFNASCNFKKPGAVAVNFGTKRTNVISFLYRRKNIFFNGDNYIQKLGVVINPSAEAALLEKFGRSMSFTPITDPGITSPIGMLTAQPGAKIYEVDTSKIGMIAKGKLDSCILSTADIYNKTYNIIQNKAVTKYLNGLIKELAEVGGVPTGKKIRDIAPQFAAMSNEELLKLEEIGIDIYSGAFLKKDDSHKTSGSDDEQVEVSYTIEGMSYDKLTYKQMVECGDKVPEFLVAVVKKFAGIEDLYERGEKAREMVDKLAKSTEVLKREIWMHKCAMYIKSNKSSVHAHDKRNWEVNPKKRTKAKCYNCKTKGYENLQLLVNNIDID